VEGLINNYLENLFSKFNPTLPNEMILKNFRDDFKDKDGNVIDVKTIYDEYDKSISSGDKFKDKIQLIMYEIMKTTHQFAKEAHLIKFNLKLAKSNTDVNLCKYNVGCKFRIELDFIYKV